MAKGRRIIWKQYLHLFLTRKLGPVKGTFHRWAEGDFKHATIKQTPTGKWFVKICVDKKDEPKNKNGKSVGIDWNCRDEDFIVMSNGTKVKCPRFLQRSSKQLSHQQKIMSKRFVKGLETQSSNYYRQKQKVALLHKQSKKDSIPLGWNMNCFQFLLKQLII